MKAILKSHFFVEILQRGILSHTPVLDIIHRLFITSGLGDILVLGLGLALPLNINYHVIDHLIDHSSGLPALLLHPYTH